MKTDDQIAEEAAKSVIKKHGLKKNGSRDYITALGWELGDGVGYERGLRDFATAVLKVERTQATPSEEEE